MLVLAGKQVQRSQADVQQRHVLTRLVATQSSLSIHYEELVSLLGRIVC